MTQSTFRFLFIFLFAISSVLNYSAAASSSSQNLFLLEKDGKNCVAKIFNIDKKDSTTWFQTSGCPKALDHFIFDSVKRRAVFLHDGKYWSVDWKKNAKPESFSEAYKLPAAKDLISSSSWMDRETGNLRAGFLVEFPHELKSSTRNQWWFSKFPNLTQEIAAKKEMNPGIPSVAMVVELGADNKWKELGAKLTTSQSDVALGMRVMDDLMTEKIGTASAQDLLMKDTCARQDCVATNLNFSAATKEWIQKTFKSAEPEESAPIEPPTYGYHRLSDHDGFIFNIALGDTYHAVPPVFYCQGSANKLCETQETTDLAEQQLSFSGKAPYAVISEEYSGLQTRIYKSGSKKVYHSFDQKTIVVTLPEELAKDGLK